MIPRVAQTLRAAVNLNVLEGSAALEEHRLRSLADRLNEYVGCFDSLSPSDLIDEADRLEGAKAVPADPCDLRCPAGTIGAHQPGCNALVNF